MLDESQGSRPEESLLTGYSGHIAHSLYLGMLSAQLGRQVIPPLLPTIIEDLSISPAQAGFVLTIVSAVSALFLYPGGRLSDQLSRKTVLVGGLSGLIVGFFAMANTTKYAILLFGGIFIGVGTGLYSIPTRALLSDLFVEKRAQAFGLYQAAGWLGSASAAGLAIAALTFGRWRYAFLPVLGLLLAALAILHVRSREPYAFSRVSLGIRETVKRVFGSTRLKWFVLCYSIYHIAWQGVLGFLPTFLQSDIGMASLASNLAFAIPFLIGMVITPVSGRLSDRWQVRIPIAAGALVMCLFGLVIMLLTTVVPLVISGVILFSLGLMSFPPAMQAHLMDIFPDRSAGADFGAFKTVYTGFGSLGPVLVGIVAGRADYTTAYAGIVILLCFGASILLLLNRSR